MHYVRRAVLVLLLVMLVLTAVPVSFVALNIPVDLRVLKKPLIDAASSQLGLDVTIEAAILDLIAELREKHQMAMLFISHNLGTVMRVCDRLGVMLQRLRDRVSWRTRPNPSNVFASQNNGSPIPGNVTG